MKIFIIFIILISFVYCFPNIDNNLPNETDCPLYTRRDWGGVPPTDTRPLKTPVEYVVIHHTYLPAACNTTDTCSAAMRSMQKYHNSLDWGDIGYNFCVGSEGGAYEGRGWRTVGIHGGSANSVSVGICLIGDWRGTNYIFTISLHPVELPPHQQLETTKSLISSGVAQGIIREDYKLIGHQQAMATECPGEALLQEIAKWSHFVQGHIDFKKNKIVKP